MGYNSHLYLQVSTVSSLGNSVAESTFWPTSCFSSFQSSSLVPVQNFEDLVGKSRARVFNCVRFTPQPPLPNLGTVIL